MHCKFRNGIHTEELTIFFLTPIISFNRRSFPVFSLNTTACWTWGTCHTLCLSPRFIFGLSRLKFDINNNDIKIIIFKKFKLALAIRKQFQESFKSFIFLKITLSTEIILPWSSVRCRCWIHLEASSAVDMVTNP